MVFKKSDSEAQQKIAPKQRDSAADNAVIAHQQAKDRNKERLLDMMARIEATDNRSIRIGFVRLYFVEKGWETAWLAEESRVQQVHDVLDLEQVLQDAQVQTILIPVEAGLNEKILRRGCERCPLPKTIFVEVE